jgi:hypothetical protein
MSKEYDNNGQAAKELLKHGDTTSSVIALQVIARRAHGWLHNHRPSPISRSRYGPTALWLVPAGSATIGGKFQPHPMATCSMTESRTSTGTILGVVIVEEIPPGESDANKYQTVQVIGRGSIIERSACIEAG